MSRVLIRKLFLYGIGGFLATGIDMLFLYIFTDILGLFYLLSQVFSFCISLIFGFVFQKYLTFKNRGGNHGRQLLLFFTFQVVGLLINLLILKISVEVFNIYYMFAALFAKGFVFLWNFVMNNFFNFKD